MTYLHYIPFLIHQHGHQETFLKALITIVSQLPHSQPPANDPKQKKNIQPEKPRERHVKYIPPFLSLHMPPHHLLVFPPRLLGQHLHLPTIQTHLIKQSSLHL
jgi:hypothetical protein